MTLFFVWDLTFTVDYLTVNYKMQLYTPLWKNEGSGDINKPERGTRAERVIIPTQKRGGEIYNSDPCPSPTEKSLKRRVSHEKSNRV